VSEDEEAEMIETSTSFGLTEQQLRESFERELIRSMRVEGEAPTVHAIAHSVARVLHENNLRLAEQLAAAGVALQ
jgi:hypothetical protein